MLVRLLLAGVAMTAWLPAAGFQTSSEEVARRQLESGRAFARQGNYAEALRDFQAVAETHATTSVADDAWLELARYYLDVGDDPVQAQRAVDAILTSYATADSAPEAYVLAGRLALARGRTPSDLRTALANFDRVSRLFPESDAVPQALQLAGQTLFWSGRLEDALARLGRVTAEYASDPSAPDASLTAGRILVALGQPVLALEELQQVRNRWPDAPAAAAALDSLTQLYRLYVRGPSGASYARTSDTPGPARLEDVVGLVAADDGRIVWATEDGLGVAVPENATPPAMVGRPRGLTTDADGRPVVIEGNVLRLPSGEPMVFAVRRSDGSPEDLREIVAAGQLSSGDWLVMDGDQQAVQRFTRDGTYAGVFANTRMSDIAISVDDRMAGISRDGDDIFVFDVDGQPLDQIQLRRTDVDLRDPEALVFDDFGHLYVLDRDAFALFTPYGPQGTGQPVYSLLSLYKPSDDDPDRFDRGEALAVDRAGTVYIYDDRAHRILVYR